MPKHLVAMVVAFTFVGIFGILALRYYTVHQGEATTPSSSSRVFETVEIAELGWRPIVGESFVQEIWTRTVIVSLDTTERRNPVGYRTAFLPGDMPMITDSTAYIVQCVPQNGSVFGDAVYFVKSSRSLL